jgi:ribA/ribD-fused uncharacterized protein
MGIHYFYGRFVKNLGGGVNIRHLPAGTEGVIFDLNGLLHFVAQKVFLYGNARSTHFASDEQFDAARDAARYRTFDSAMLTYIAELQKEIVNVIVTLRPKQYLIIAVDGVAPGAKLAQQRARRYVAAADNTPSNAPVNDFTSASISPGSTFMVTVDTALRAWLARAVAVRDYASRFMPPNVVYSPHTVPGEGEHKAFGVLRDAFNAGVVSQGGGGHVVYGMDADLMVLALASPVRNIFLSREDLSNNVNVEALFTVIKREMTGDGAAPAARFSDETLRRDFIVLTTLLGNDFMPHTPSFDVMVPDVFEAYAALAEPLAIEARGGGFAVAARPFANLHAALARGEEARMRSEAREQATVRGAAARIAPIAALADALDLRTNEFSFSRAKRGWYAKSRSVRIETASAGGTLTDEASAEIAKPGPFVARMVGDYAATVEWVLRYYTGGGAHVNWLSAYRFMLAPFSGDVASRIGAWFSGAPDTTTLGQFFSATAPAEPRAPFWINGISERDGFASAGGRPAIAPVHQLLAIIPLVAFDGVVGIRALGNLLDDGGPLDHIAPEPKGVTRDNEGKKKEYLAVPILPEVDLREIVSAVTAMEIHNREARTAEYTAPAAVARRKEQMDDDGFITTSRGIRFRPKQVPTVNAIVPKRLGNSSYGEATGFGPISGVATVSGRAAGADVAAAPAPAFTGRLVQAEDPSLAVPDADDVAAEAIITKKDRAVRVSLRLPPRCVPLPNPKVDTRAFGAATGIDVDNFTVSATFGGFDRGVVAAAAEAKRTHDSEIAVLRERAAKPRPKRKRAPKAAPADTDLDGRHAADATPEPAPLADDTVGDGWFPADRGTLIQTLNDFPDWRPNYLMFPDETNHDYLSNSYVAPFVLEAVTYNTLVHFIEASKANFFKDAASFAAIVAAETPEEAAALGDAVEGYNRSAWLAEVGAILEVGVVRKFKKHGKLRTRLLGTGNRVLVNADSQDAVFSVGRDRLDPRARDPRAWTRDNTLGFTLMLARMWLLTKNNKKRKEQKQSRQMTMRSRSGSESGGKGRSKSRQVTMRSGGESGSKSRRDDAEERRRERKPVHGGGAGAGARAQQKDVSPDSEMPTHPRRSLDPQDFSTHAIARRLARDGIATVPIYKPSTLTERRADILAARRDVPFLKEDRPADTLGTFCTLNDPHSAWHPTFRLLRRTTDAPVRAVLQEYARSRPDTVSADPGRSAYRIAAMFDRVMLRPKGIPVGGEAWHRDVAMNPDIPKDGRIEIFGGWTNLDEHPHRFRCVLGTHKGPDGEVLDVRALGTGGFARIQAADRPRLDKAATDFVVPPGHHVIFHQHVCHTICPSKGELPVHRMFHGFMLCNSPTWNSYVFGGDLELRRLAADQATPLTPSGQPWTVYAQMHMFFLSRPFKIRKGDQQSEARPLRAQLRRIFTDEYCNAFERGDNRIISRTPASYAEMLSQKVVSELLPVVEERDIALYIPSDVPPPASSAAVPAPADHPSTDW